MLSALAAAPLVVVTAACQAADVLPPDPPEPPDADGPALGQALAAEEALLAAYDATLVAFPSVVPRLASLRQEHAVHAARLRELGAEVAEAPTAGPAATASAPTTPGAAGTPGTPPRPTDPAAARAGLTTAERAATALHARLAATSTPRTAPLLASLSAAEASHLVVLALP